MSISFYIKPKKKIFSVIKVLTVHQILDISTVQLTQFTFDQEEHPEAMQASLTDFDSLKCGIIGESGRGFTLTYDTNSKSYNVRINSPSTIKDWQIALKFVQDLAKHFNVKINDENDECHTVDTILDFDYLHDINSGINLLKTIIEGEGKDSNVTVFGVFRPVHLNLEMVKKIDEAGNSAQEFSEIMMYVQNIEAHSARQLILQKEDIISGTYLLTEMIQTILPFKPELDFEYGESIDENSISKWTITLAHTLEDNSIDILAELNYDTFIGRLPKDKYQWIDAKSIMVDGLSFEEMNSLVK